MSDRLVLFANHLVVKYSFEFWCCNRDNLCIPWNEFPRFFVCLFVVPISEELEGGLATFQKGCVHSRKDGRES